MVTLIRTTLALLWSLWFGGIMSVFLFAIALFNGLGRESAALATGVMFPSFERYSLVLAALCLAATVAWRALTPSRAPAWTFAFLAAATLFAITSAAVITPRILHLRSLGQVHTPDFARAHAISGVLYVAESISLLLAGIILLSAPRRHAAPITPA
ncbi:MAG TPA: DUF4149 domain-containing protein [Tepidisphaeraceae bacterium]|jgi:hypothetical protein|nr:DUF4149 domain-containing protein [Tepidisphaeraceae bacterium]